MNKQMNHQRIAIIGAGISGLSVANLLTSHGNNVVVFEQNNQIGGLVKCTVEDGVLFHRVGGHVFNTKIKKVEDWFWKQFSKDDEFILAKRNAKIWLDNKYIGYPIENYLYQLEKSITSKIISDLLDNMLKNNVEIEDFDHFLNQNFGKTLYDLYFKPYNNKIWNTDLSKVPLPWLDGKLPMPNIQDIIIDNIYKADDKLMVHSSFFYPKENGSSFIVNKLAKNISISIDSKISTIIRKNDCWDINGQIFDSAIFTGDVRRLYEIIQIDNAHVLSECKTVQNLLSNGTSNALCYVDDSDLSWLYLPELKTKSHRIIFTGNFSPNDNADNRLTCTVEFSGILSEREMKDELKRMPGNLQPIAFNQEPNSYVIQHSNTRELISKLKSVLNPFNFFLLGRFAEWEYYNMDKAIEAAMKLVEEQF